VRRAALCPARRAEGRRRPRSSASPSRSP
jgi:hypothetical protein